MIPAAGGEGVDHHVRTVQSRVSIESFHTKIISELNTPGVRIEPRASRNVGIVLILPRRAFKRRIERRKGNYQRSRRVRGPK